MNDTIKNVLIVVEPALLALLVGLLGLGLKWVTAKIGVDKDGAYGAALTNAVNTFAGLTINDINSGKLTLADVKAGKITNDLKDYLNKTVSEALQHFNKPAEDLNKMLLGKIGAAIGVVPAIIVDTTGSTAPLTDALKLSQIRGKIA